MATNPPYDLKAIAAKSNTFAGGYRIKNEKNRGESL